MKPVNKQNLYDSLLTILGALFAGAGISLFVYLWIEFGDLGMQADALYTSGLDMAAAILMVVLIIVSVICFRLIKDMSASYRRKLRITTYVTVVAVIIVTFLIAPFFTYR